MSIRFRSTTVPASRGKISWRANNQEALGPSPMAAINWFSSLRLDNNFVSRNQDIRSSFIFIYFLFFYFCMTRCIDIVFPLFPSLSSWTFQTSSLQEHSVVNDNNHYQAKWDLLSDSTIRNHLFGHLCFLLKCVDTFTRISILSIFEYICFDIYVFNILFRFLKFKI